MREHRIWLPALGALLLGVTVACSSSNPYKQHRETLTRASADLEASRLEAAAKRLDGLLAETADDSKTFVLQRFYAAWLMTQVHMRAAEGEAFLKERSSSSAGGIGIGAAGGSSGGTQGSAVGHLVAATMSGGYGQDWFAAAQRSPKREDGEALLPQALEELEVASAKTNLDLCQMVVYTRLGFRDSVERTLDASPPLLVLESCESLLESAKLEPGLRPWIFLAVFEYLRDRDQPAAFPFGVRALEAARRGGGSLDATRTASIAAWMSSGSAYVFKCPQCNQPVVPALTACQNDQTPHLEFYAERRSEN